MSGGDGSSKGVEGSAAEWQKEGWTWILFSFGCGTLLLSQLTHQLTGWLEIVFCVTPVRLFLAGGGSEEEASNSQTCWCRGSSVSWHFSRYCNSFVQVYILCASQVRLVNKSFYKPRKHGKAIGLPRSSKFECCRCVSLSRAFNANAFRSTCGSCLCAAGSTTGSSAQTGPLPAVGPQGSLGLKTMVKLAVVPRVELIPRNCSSQTKVCKASPGQEGQRRRKVHWHQDFQVLGKYSREPQTIFDFLHTWVVFEPKELSMQFPKILVR